MSDKIDYIVNATTKLVRGFPIPIHSLFKPEYTEQAMEYQPREGDVILFGYPKTGSTWLLYVVWNILNKCQRTLKDLSEILILETCGKDAIDAIPEPRLYKYHLPADRIRISDKAKYIYIHRNPADILVSYYHFLKGTMDIKYDFDPFFKAFIAGKLPYGDHFDHVLAAYKHKSDSNFLFLAYEDSKEDPLGEVMRIAKFLGGQYYQQFIEDSSLAEKIVKATSFEHMKKNLTFSDNEAEGGPKPMDYYFRKGAVGEGKSYMSEEQKKRFQEIIKRKMQEIDSFERWLL